MADELKIVVKALLDEKDLRAQTEAIKDVTIHGKIVIDKADLKKQIDSIAGESSKFGNKFKIKYGVDKGDFVKQFRVAGEEAKRVVEKALAGAGAGVDIPLNINPDAVKTLKNELKKLKFDDDTIASATKELEGMNVTVTKIRQGYETVADAQAKLKTLTISGVDKNSKQDVTIIQKYNTETKELQNTLVNVTSKYNEMGAAVARVATTMRGTGSEAANQVFSEKLDRLVSSLKTSGTYTEDMKQKTDALRESLKSAFDQPSIDAVNDQYRVLIERAKTLKQEAAVVTNSPVTRIDTNTAKLSTSLSYQGMDAQTAGITNLRNEINSLIAEYGRLKASMDGLDPNSAEFQALGVQVDALDTRFKSATKAAELFNGTITNKAKLAGIDDQIRKAKSSLEELESKWSKFKGNPNLLAEFEQLQKSAQQLDATNLQNFNKQLASFKTNVRAAGADTRSFGDELKNALAKFGLWITASSIFMQVWRGMRQMVDSVKELDAALVEFNKVADLSSSQLDKFVDRAFKAGEALGRTGTEVIQATAIFKQAGYTVEESLNLANSALVMKNVSENIESTAAAASDLIAVMKGFDMAVADSMSIVDMINNVSNNLPISFGAIDEGLTRISGTLAQTGTSIQETIGLITGGFASLRNVEKVSSGLIQISQRLRGIGESGETIDGLAPKLQSMFKEIAGIDIADTNGELRSTFDILSDLAKVADDLTSKERQLLFQEASGTRQVTVLNSIIQNWDDVSKAVDKATNSTGSAMQENEKFLNSIQGKTNRLASSFQMLANNTIESGFIKGLIDFANAIVQVVDKIGLLSTALIGITGFTTLFTNGKVATTVAALGKSFVNMAKSVVSLPKVIKQSSDSFIGPLQAGTQKISKFNLAVLGVTAAFTVAKYAFDSYTNSLEEQRRKSEELLGSWESTRENLTSNKATIEELKTEFASLSNGVDSFGNNISLTSDEFSRYHQITNQIAGMFPEMVSGYDNQGNAILTVKGNVEQLTAAYKEQEQAARNAIINSAPAVFGQQKTTYASSGDVFGVAQTGLSERIEMYNRLIQEIKRMQSEGDTQGEVQLGQLLDGSAYRAGINAYNDTIEELSLSLSRIREDDIASFTMSEEETRQNMSALENGKRVLMAEMKTAAMNVVPIMRAYLFNDDEFSQIGEDVQNMLIGVISSLDPDYIFKHSNAFSLMESIFGDIVNPVISSPTAQQNIMSAFTDVDAFRAGKKTVEEYAQTIANLRKTLANVGVDQELAVKFVDMAEIDNVDALIENVKLKLQDEFDDNVGELTLNQLRLGGDLKVEDGELLSWQQFIGLVSQASAVLSSLTIGERLDAIANAASVANSAFSEQGYSAAVTKEQYDKLAEAGEEYVSVIDNTNGYLSINKQKLDALILSKRNEEKANIAIAKAAKLAEFDKNAKEIQSLSNQVNLLGDAYDDTKQSLLDKNAALIANQDAILEEVKNLDLQASALEYATSAYKRWLDAKNAPEAGDMYNELPNAWKAIEEGLKTGKVGTEKYLSAVELLIPDSVDKNDEKAIAKYKKSVMEYFTEDGSGLNKFTKGLLAGGFMEQLDDGSYVGTAKANIESIASSLNLTESAVEALFLALKDYGWNVELNDGAYETTEAAQALEKATNDLTTAQDKLSKAKISGASAEEIKTLEKNVDAAQGKVDTLSSTEITPKMSTGEQLLSEIQKLQADVDKLLINIPATLNPDLSADLLAIQTSLNTDATLIAKARIDGDPQLLNEKLAELTSETDQNGNPKTPIQLSIDAQRTAAYKAAILEINNLKTQPPTTTLTVAQSGAEEAGNAIDAVAKDRNITIFVDDEKLSEAEERLAKLQADMDEDDLEGKDPPLSVLHGGPGHKATAEEIGDFWAGQDTNKAPSTPPRVDPDQEEVHLLETLSAAEKKANEIRQTVKESTLASIKSEQPNFQEIDRWAEHLQSVVSDLETKKESLNQNGIQLSPEDSGKLDAYKEVLDDLVAPKTITLDADGNQVVSKTDGLVKDIEGRNPTLTVNVEYEGKVPGFAKGTKKAKKGVALTGEEGVETVITKDGFYTVGHDGPELVNLRGGEEILNDKDTKKLFRGTNKNVSGQAFGGGTTALDKIKGIFTKAVSAISNAPIVKQVVKVVDGAIKKAFKGTTAGFSGKNLPGGNNNRGGGGGGGSSSPAPVEQVKEEIKTDFEDWIPRLLDNVRKQTDRLLANAEKQISYQSQNTEIEKALANNTKLMDLNSQATNRYLQQAARVGLSGDLISKVQNGSIDIALYDENTRKLIADYQKWYDLAQKTKDTITSLQEEQRKLAMSKLDNVQGYYENRIGLYGNRLDIANSTIELGQATGREIKRDDYKAMISDVNAQLALLRQEKAEYEKTFTELVASGVIKEGSNDWYQYTAKVDDMQKSILQASLSLDEFNDLADAIAVNNLNVAIKYLNIVQGTLESVQGLRQAQGNDLTAVDYEHLISVGMQQVSALEAQNLELLKQQEGLDVLSSAYQEIQDQIDGNLNGIWNIKTSQEGWNDAITDLNINAIKKSNEQYNRQLGTMRAIEELEKAKQRRNLVYREGRGFVYEADQGALRDAQSAVDQINIDNLIASLEESKANDNVYDSTGNLLGKLFTGLDGVDFSGYLQSVGSGNETSALLANAIKSIDWNSIRTASGAPTSVEFSGGINLYGVDNVQDLAKAINNRLGGYVTQGLYNND